jgi:hypothetical protein
LGDLSGPPLRALVCPNSLIGPVDIYLVSHHGGADARDPSTFAAFHPRVAVLNNGATKGGARETFAELQRARSTGTVQDVWQLHRSENVGAQNFAEDHIANLAETTAHWIKVSASGDGSFRVTNARTNATTTYLPPRQP